MERFWKSYSVWNLKEAYNMMFKPSLRANALRSSDAPTKRSAVNGFAIVSQPNAPQVRRLTWC